MVGKIGNMIPTAPRTSVIVPTIKKSARTNLLLLVSLGVSVSCCIVLTDGLMILKFLLFSGKNTVLFTNFAKNGFSTEQTMDRFLSVELQQKETIL